MDGFFRNDLDVHCLFTKSQTQLLSMYDAVYYVLFRSLLVFAFVGVLFVEWYFR